MIAIIDYGVGNLFSLRSSFAFLGIDSIVTDKEEEIERADRIILPGVGAFKDAAEKLKQTGMGDCLLKQVEKGKPVMGICLGMQLLFEKSYEYGEHKGLGLIEGSVIPMEGNIAPGLKIPHIGWNKLEFTENKSPIFKYINDGDYVYFVHSYYGDRCEKNTIAVTDYSVKMCAAVQNGNIFGCQFHPEKSGETGLKILKAFAETEV